LAVNLWQIEQMTIIWAATENLSVLFSCLVDTIKETMSLISYAIADEAIAPNCCLIMLLHIVDDGRN